MRESCIRSAERIRPIIAAQDSLCFHSGKDTAGVSGGKQEHGVDYVLSRCDPFPVFTVVGGLPEAFGGRRIQSAWGIRVLNNLLCAATAVRDALQFRPRGT